MATDTERIDRDVQRFRRSEWLAPGVTAGSLPKVPTTTLGTLPTASAAFRGRLIMVYGATTVADGFYVCVKDAADAYSWVAMPGADLSAIPFMVGTASGLLSAEYVSGTTPSIGYPSQILRWSNTAEVTTVATSAADLLTSGTLSIPVTSGLLITGVVRKTTGAAAGASLGLKVNSTVIVEADPVNTAAIWHASTGNNVDDGSFRIEIMPRSANYLRGMIATYYAFVAGSGSSATSAASLPNATITSIALRGISGSASVTLAVKECAVYEILYA